MLASFPAIIMLVALGSDGATDLVSMLDAPAYFKSRNIRVTTDNMMKHAGKTPSRGKEEISQLLAIRWLGEHPASVKENKAGLNLLKQIAVGEKGKDAQGFAADYARLALARLEGKTVVLQTLPADSVRGDALGWFPKQCTIFGSFDLRPPKGAGVAVGTGETLRNLLAKEMPARAREEMYSFVDKVGNLRLDRVSLGVIPDVNQEDQTRIFVRLTGKGHRKGLVDYLSKELGGAQVEDKKGPSGESVTVIHYGKPPALALVGNTDLLVCGFQGRRGKNKIVIDKALEVRAGNKESILKGSYARALQTSPSKASGVLIGELPERWRKELTGRGSPFRALPQHVQITFTRKAKVLTVRFTGSAENAKGAKAFADSVLSLKRMGLEALKKAPDVMKPKTVEALQTALKSIKMDSSDALLTGSATLSNEGARAILELGPLMLFGIGTAKYEARPVDPKK
jgi:hypothetical protein